MFNPDGCFCCEPPEDPCTMTGCTWSSTDMSDTDLTAGTTYNNPSSGSTPDGTYEVTNVQDTSTGNDAPCRKITIETAVAPSKAESVYAICWKDNATHNPATQCPLTNVSFCVESKRHADADSGLTDGVVFVVRQNGKIYATATQAVGVNWKRASGTYTSASFTWVNGTGNPNFTATGSAIEFGFALKLSVPKNGTPYDVVMFDNLCITKFAGCGGTPCSPANCDSYNTGNSLAIDSQASGTNYSVDSLIGLPAESHKYEFPINSQQKSVTSVLSSDVFLGGTCTTPSSVLVCVNHQSDVPVGNPSGNGHSISFKLRQGSVSVSFGQVFIPGDSSGVWSLHSATYTFPVSTPFSFSSPVELLMTVSGGNRTAIGVVWIDNICVKANTDGCQCHVDSLLGTIQGVNVVYSGLYDNLGTPLNLCQPEMASFANEALASTMILTKSQFNTCTWMANTSKTFTNGYGSFVITVSLSVSFASTATTAVVAVHTAFSNGSGTALNVIFRSSDLGCCEQKVIPLYGINPGLDKAHCLDIGSAGSSVTIAPL